MIIKVSRGNNFAGVVDYIARLGVYARKDEARVVALERLYDLRTAAAQLAYDAALDPSRSRPVVHLIARAEKGLRDDQYVELTHRMLKAAGLDGHRFIATAHDDDGHLHVVASEVDQDGAVPPRILWHKQERRIVTAEEAKTLPRGKVEGRAWDSHLAWRLTRVSREVEIDWDLRRLSSSAKANDPVEPRREQWQKERLARTGMVPLQDRYWTEVRAALALPSWDERAAALAEHGLVIRAHEVGGRPRGLQVQSLTNANDFVKISAFGMGGMPKLDASAGQKFLTWAAQERRLAINLSKPATSRTPDMIAMQAAFKAHQKDWRRREGARIAAYRQRRRDTAAIEADMANFAERFQPILTVRVFRQARAEKRRGLKALADARLAEALAASGPQTPQPVFIDFVKARAGTGDASAGRVYRDIATDVSETRRRSLDRVAAMAAELAAAVRALRERRDIVGAEVAVATAALRRKGAHLAQQAAAETARMKAGMQTAARDTRARLAILAERLAQRLDAAGHRIRVTDKVNVDRWVPGQVEREIVEVPASRRIFEQYARLQTGEVEALRDDVHRTGAVRRDGLHVTFDAARSGIGNAQVLRWADEPEVVAALRQVDRRRREAEVHAERIETERRRRHANVALDGLRAAKAAQALAASAWLAIQMADDLRQTSAAIRKRAAGLAIRGVDLRDDVAVAQATTGYERELRADEVLAQVLADRGTRRIRDEKAAEHGEREDRLATVAILKRQNTHLPAEQRWIELWQEILAERPLDTTVTPFERNRSIDYEVAAAMLHEGVTLAQTRSSMTRLSPALSALTSHERPAYIDMQVDALEHILRRMSPDQRARTRPKPVSARALASMSEAENAARNPRSKDDDPDRVSDTLPGSPPSTSHVAETVDNRAAINGFELHNGNIAAANAPAQKAHKAAVESNDGEPLFDEAGQPTPRVRAILDGIRHHRAAFKLDQNGRLTAPGQTVENQKLFADLLADPRFEQLALTAFRGSAGTSGAALAIGGANER